MCASGHEVEKFVSAKSLRALIAVLVNEAHYLTDVLLTFYNKFNFQSKERQTNKYICFTFNFLGVNFNI